MSHPLMTGKVKGCSSGSLSCEGMLGLPNLRSSSRVVFRPAAHALSAAVRLVKYGHRPAPSHNVKDIQLQSFITIWSNLATIFIDDELRNTTHVQLIKSVQCRSRTYTLTSYNHLLPQQIMRPTSSLLGASRLPLTTKRANKDFYKGTSTSSVI